MKKGFLIAILLMAYLHLQAQINDDNMKRSKTKLAARIVDTTYKHSGFNIYLTIPALTFSGPIQLNGILSSQQVPELSRFMTMGGLGFEDRWKWFACGLDFASGEQYAENDRYDVTSTVTFANIYLKYYVFKSKSVGGIYPLVGITARNQSVYITDKTSANDIKGLFTQSGAVNLHLSSGFLNTGIGFDLLDFKEEGSFYGSFRMGFLTNISSKLDNEWYISESRILAGSPREKLNSFYASISVGYNINHFSRRQQRILK